MRRNALLAASYSIDQLLGDPEYFPHPVRLIGIVCECGESLLRRVDDSNRTEIATGALLTVGVVATTYFATGAMITNLRRASGSLGTLTEVLLGWTCIAARNLQQEAGAVNGALINDDLALARQQLSRIVGRDTQSLAADELNRALIETLAESTSDGVVAPLFYMMLGGVPLAMTYKAINTLDSMIGHANKRYFYFGKVAARLDDAANYLPSRITALLMIGVAFLSKGYDGASAMKLWRRDARKHKSPNAGQPESAMSGALCVRLGGSNFYAGELVHAEVIGNEFPAANLSSVKRALRLASFTSLACVVTCFILAGYAFDQDGRR